jgi:hypothetical protein
MAISRSTSTNSIQFVVAPDTLTSLPPQSQDKDIQVDLSWVSRNVDQFLDDESQTEDTLFSRSESPTSTHSTQIPEAIDKSRTQHHFLDIPSTKDSTTCCQSKSGDSIQPSNADSSKLLPPQPNRVDSALDPYRVAQTGRMPRIQYKGGRCLWSMVSSSSMTKPEEIEEETDQLHTQSSTQQNLTQQDSTPPTIVAQTTSEHSIPYMNRGLLSLLFRPKQ